MGTINNLTVCVLVNFFISLSSTITYNVSENITPGSSISTFNKPCIKYTLEDLICCSVDEVNGVLSVAVTLDREVEDRYEGKLVCNVIQSTLPLKYDVLVTIDDIDDNDPVFDKPIQYLNISEHAKLNQRFPLEGARDDDADANSVQGYTLYDDTFGVTYGSLTDGVLPLSIYLKSTLDYEMGPRFYNLTITAYDTDTSIQLIVIIYIVDENDNKPVFDAILYIGNVSELAPPHTYVMTVRATDADSGLNARVDYSIVSINIPFKVSLAGNITVAGPLDREKTGQYTFRVKAQDRGEPSLSSVTNVRITILDYNDNKPQIIRPAKGEVIRVRENVPATTLVTTIKISDQDIGQNAQVDVVVEGVHSDRFQYTYQSTTNYFVYGTLTTTLQLDREDVPKYILVLKVTDRGSSPLSSKVQFTVVVEDSNDNQPVLDCSVTFTTKENYIGPIGTLLATDKDEGRNAELLYFLQTPDYPGYVTVNKTTGQVSVLIAFDAEDVNNVMMLVDVQDNGTAPHSTQCNMTLYIVDINDNKPSFIKDIFTFNVLENVPIYTVIGSVQATDPDKLDQLLYSLEQPSSVFIMTERNGQIRVKNSLDRETTPYYKLRCVVRDSVYNTTAVLIVNVLDINDEEPTYHNTPYRVSISAAASVGKVLFRPVVSDNDELSVLTFSLDNNNLFTVDHSTGDISLAQPLPVQSTIKEEVTVKLSVTDGNHTAVTLVTFIVYSNDGSTPVITVHQGFNVQEDCGLGTIVGKCNGTSLYPTVLSLLTYNDSFIIESNGDIRTKRYLDYEHHSRYSLECKITDLHGNSAQSSIIVDIIGVNEFQPMFKKNFYTFTMIDDVPANMYPRVIGSVQATDKDAGNDGLLRYYLLTNNTDYTINMGSGEILLKYKPNLEEDVVNYHSVNLEVGVKDSPLSTTHVLTSSVQITVSIYPVQPATTKILTIVGYTIGGLLIVLLFAAVLLIVQRKRRSQRGSKDVTYVNPTAMLQSFQHVTPHNSPMEGQIVLGGLSREPYTSEELCGYPSLSKEEKGSISTVVSDYRPQFSRGVICSVPLKASSEESVHVFETEGGGEGDAMLDTASLFNKLAGSDVKALFLGYDHDSAFSSLHSSSDLNYNTDYLQDWRPDFQSVSTVAEGMLQCKEFAYKQSCSPSHTVSSSHLNSSNNSNQCNAVNNNNNIS